MSPHRTGPGGSQGPGGSHNILAALLLLLDEWPMPAPHLVRTISQRSGTHWAPTLGLVRGGLSALEGAAMVAITEVDGRAEARLTSSGMGFVDRNRQALGEPWDDFERAAGASTALPQAGGTGLIASSGDDA